MLDPHERWDVVVVGADASGRPSSQSALVELAAQLGRHSGLSSREIQHALLLGEVRVHAALGREEADAAAQKLGELGARVELRPASTGVGAGPQRVASQPPTPATALPQLEPDPEGPSAAAGGIGPPPRFGEHGPVAPEPTAGVRVDTSRVQGRPEQFIERPFPPDRARPRAVLGRADGSPPDRDPVDPNRVTAKAGELDEVVMRVARGLSAARRAKPDPNIARPPPRAGEIGGADRPVLPRSLHPAPTPPASSASRPAGATGSASPLQAAPALELDLDAVRFGAASPSARAAQARLEAASSIAADSGAASTAPPSPYGPDASGPSTFGPAAPRRLLGRDPIAALILGFVISAAAGIVVALLVTRSMIDDDVRPLETQLAAAQAGESTDRSVEEIESELDEALTSLRLRFFIAWAATAVPLGLLLGRLRLS